MAWRSTMMDGTWLSARPREVLPSGIGTSVGWSGGCRWISRPAICAFDPEGRRLAVANRDRAAPRVVILEAETGQVLADWRTQVGNHVPVLER